MTICKPLAASVSSFDEVVAVVVRVTEDIAKVPPLVRSKLRCIVSPAAMLLALTLSRLVDAPVAPSTSDRVPDPTVWLAVAVPEKVANVPRPAIDAAEPNVATDRRTFFAIDVRRFWCLFTGISPNALDRTGSRPFDSSVTFGGLAAISA